MGSIVRQDWATKHSTTHSYTVNFYLKKKLASDWSRSQVALPPFSLIIFFNHLFAESGDTKVVSRTIQLDWILIESHRVIMPSSVLHHHPGMSKGEGAQKHCQLASHLHVFSDFLCLEQFAYFLKFLFVWDNPSEGLSLSQSNQELLVIIANILKFIRNTLLLSYFLGVLPCLFLWRK